MRQQTGSRDSAEANAGALDQKLITANSRIALARNIVGLILLLRNDE
ncbi:MAG: hypothetical protein JO319_18690 [Acidobacteriaceae bacterium]|nr:hypothetical protein [Acidobacteriaceae bacterium]